VKTRKGDTLAGTFMPAGLLLKSLYRNHTWGKSACTTSEDHMMRYLRTEVPPREKVAIDSLVVGWNEDGAMLLLTLHRADGSEVFFSGYDDQDVAPEPVEPEPRPKPKTVVTNAYKRNPAVAAEAKRLANGICQLCGKPAPFTTKKDEPYLETHHIVWLSEGGEDTVKNTAALCPNCHRRVHILNDPDDQKDLL